MINMNLVALRKRFHMTQEEVAEKINVTRQAIAKWEKGESVPDMDNCIALADLFQVSVDELVRHDETKTGIAIAPKGKHFFGSVTVGDRGQIVIPKKAREVFYIQPGDQLLIFGDEERGLGIVPKEPLFTLMNSISDNDSFFKKKSRKEDEDE